MLYNKINTIILGLLMFNPVYSLFMDFIDKEVILEYDPEQIQDSFVSTQHKLQIDIFQENNYIEANTFINHDSISESVNHFKIINVFDEPETIFFNGIQLDYLNWYYNHDDQSIEIVNIEHDISNSFIIEWNNDIVHK